VSWLAVAVLAVALSSEIALEKLPPEARHTVAVIKAGGPFPYQRDGSVFYNREGLLPKRSRGYYREYTVKTPGAKDRGARRIVAGQGGEFYYTDDHYRSFRRIIE
jgi:ribonuclease T1